MNARALLRVDALGCAVAALIGAVRGGWTIAILLAISAVAIGLLTRAPERDVVLVTRLVALGNLAWAAVIAGVLDAGWITDSDAVLLWLTVPYTIGLGFLQLRAARSHAVVSAG